MKKICLLGASGTIGKSTLDIIQKFEDEFTLYSFSVYKNLEAAKAIIKKFQPKYLCIASDQVESSILGHKYQNTTILYGKKALEELVEDLEVDIVVNAIVGANGIYPTISAIRSNKKIAIANKEPLVSFGPVIKDLLKSHNSKLLPIDSEHNSIFQLLEFHSQKVKSIILTASGGSLRDIALDEFCNVTVERVLKHPTWNMGAKITVDCATMVNKCLEVIEANILFDIDYNNIDILIHPESIVHGIVENHDGSQMMYSSYPDMKIPIAHCLFYPNFSTKTIRSFSPKNWSSLNFSVPNLERYPILKILPQVGKTGGTSACVFNAANEAAVDLFLQKKINFTKIVELIDECLNKIPVIYTNHLIDFIAVDKQAREFVYQKFKE